MGIGGSGMGPIAIILAQQGYLITGSDINPNVITEYLISLGVTIYFTHHSSHIQQAYVVVISTAIDHNNPEIRGAYEAHIPVISRAEMLSELIKDRYSIAVSGTHGKTTTTALISTIYMKAGLDPTFINGGILKDYGTCSHLGTSKYLIFEADESDASFLCLHPIVAVITNINPEHMETYKGKITNLQLSFINFLHNLPEWGHIIICLDNMFIRQIWPLIQGTRKITTYGFSRDADICITNYYQKNLQSYFILRRKNKINLSICLNLPGEHNALNATGAIAVATEEGIHDTVILQSLQYYQGTVRRFDFLGRFPLHNFNGKKGSVLIVDDYGHHPMELSVTIKTVRVSWPQKRLVMIFQPHRYTRTRNLYNEFISILSQVDILFLLEIDSAGEKPISGVHSNDICTTINNRYKKRKKVIFVETHYSLINLLYFFLNDNDVILIQGAGNIKTISEMIIANLVKTFQ